MLIVLEFIYISLLQLYSSNILLEQVLHFKNICTLGTTVYIKIAI